eukprot:TRINITY_DN5674_c0_g1_i1.p1 TRINITY_DN5674_c0_g1~~TRINITY_DN5674_c0_g1_i1.p1  ORF type:complete len:231 (+),score=38.46 TRINITY_DN5674_c0_g1_i1:70-693(+)
MASTSSPHRLLTQSANQTVDRDSAESSLKFHLAHFGLPDGRSMACGSGNELHNAQTLAEITQAATSGTKELKLLSFQGMHDEINAQILAQIKQQAGTGCGPKELKLFSSQGTLLRDNGKPFVCQVAGGYSDHPLAHSQGCCAPCSFAYRHQQDPERYPQECLKKDCERCHKVHSPEYMRRYKGDVQRFRRQKAKTTQHVMFEGGFIF